MDNNWQTFGHEGVKNILARQVALEKFPHAYLFAGAPGVGKKTLALEFAKKVLGTEKLENHPDFQILDLGSGEITVEPVLGFISQLAFKPFLAGRKIAVINNADNLNTQSSNALLKTLEEPSASTIIILIAGPKKLLPTIVSRCQTFYFNTFSEKQLREFAETKGLKPEKNIIELSFGKISDLVELAENKELVSAREASVKSYEQYAKMGAGDRLLAINQYAELEVEELEQNLTLWINWQSKKLCAEPRSYTKLQALSNSLAGFKLNKNKKFLLQTLFLKI